MPRLKDRRLIGAIKEPRRDAQCTDLVTSGPRLPDLVGFANAFHQHGARE